MKMLSFEEALEEQGQHIKAVNKKNGLKNETVFKNSPPTARVARSVRKQLN